MSSSDDLLSTFADCASSAAQASLVRAKKRHGYIKPHTQPFSDSARKRSSVMALGHIDYLQHRFAKADRITGRSKPPANVHLSSPKKHLSDLEVGNMSQEYQTAASDQKSNKIDEEEEEEEDPTTVPLPPSPQRMVYARQISNELDPNKLRKMLENQLNSCSQQLDQYIQSYRSSEDSEGAACAALQLVEAVTLCIRTARTFSTSIPSDLSLATSFSVFREDALSLLATVRALAEREAEGGLLQTERSEMKDWIRQLKEYLNTESSEDQKAAMAWLYEQNWSGKTKERYLSFLRFYDASPDIFVDSTKNRVEFLQQLRTGVRLCQIYNAVVRRSLKPFGVISKFHLDTAIRYRVLENLKYWKAAVEYRFGIAFKTFSVQDIFDGTESGLSELETAVELFCSAVITEMSKGVDLEGQSEDDMTATVESLCINRNSY